MKTNSFVKSALFLSGISLLLISFLCLAFLPKNSILGVFQVLLILRITGSLFLFGFGLMHRKLGTWIWISLILGIQIGFDFPEIAHSMHVLSLVFLRLIKTLLAPLLFSTLVYGIASHSDLKQVGRMGWKSILYFEILTTFALLIGVVCINISQAGHGIPTPVKMEKSEITKPMGWEDTVLHIFPENIAKSIAEGQILQVVVFSIFFGIGLAQLPLPIKKPMLEFSHSLSEVMFRFTGLVMYLAPLAVGSAIAYTVAGMGLDILNHLLVLVVTLYTALFLFILLILLPIIYLYKIPIFPFIRTVSEPVSLAFATASSEAALPKAMTAMEKFGVPRHIVSFVLPTGYSFNLEGSTIYLAIASIFIAQATGKSLSLNQELVMVLTLMLASKGVAGIPRASFAILTGMTASFGLETWPLFILFGIDGILDMGRTGLSVLGNCLATVVIARSEKEFDREMALKN